MLTDRHIKARSGYRHLQLQPRPTVTLWRHQYSTGTFAPGRNAEKRKARVDQTALRAMRIEMGRDEEDTRHVRKRKLSWPLISMLADRRLRQQHGEDA